MELAKRRVPAPDLICVTTVVYAALFFLISLEFLVILRFRPEAPVLAAEFFFLTFCSGLVWERFAFAPETQQMLGRTGPVVAAGAALWGFLRYRRGIKRLQRRTLPLMLGCSLVGGLAILGGEYTGEQRALARLPNPAPESPNVLVVIVDTLRADHLSTYGYSRATSPYLTRLAEQGVLFENAVASSSWTLPTHASMLTGRPVHEHRADRETESLDGRYPTIGDAFQAHGYATAAFSANTALFSRATGLGRGFLHFEDYLQSFGAAAEETFFGERIEVHCYRLGICRDIPGRLSARDINIHALRWIERTRRPFLVFLNYLDVHSPYEPPETPARGFHTRRPGKRVWLDWQPELTPEQLQGEVDAYDSGIAYVDEQIGNLMEQLAERGLEKNTLVVVVSDHGEGFDEHGLLTHGNSLYRELIHVPLLFRWPGKLPEGVRIGTPVSTTWLPATLLQLATGRAEGEIPGPSLAPLWQIGARPEDFPDPVSELSRVDFLPPNKHNYGPMESVTTAEWHYVLGAGTHEELYRYQEDAKEAHDSAGTPEGKAICKKLAQELAERRHSTSAAMGTSGNGAQTTRTGQGNGQ